MTKKQSIYYVKNDIIIAKTNIDRKLDNDIIQATTIHADDYDIAEVGDVIYSDDFNFKKVGKDYYD